MTNYSRGADKERELESLFRDAGVIWVARTAGSHGPIDVIACYPSVSILAQVKYGDRPTLSLKEKKLLLLLATVLPTLGVIGVMWKKRLVNPDFMIFSPAASTRANLKRLLLDKFPESNLTSV